MKFIIIIKIILHNINFVKIIIVGPKNQNQYFKLNVPYFWNNYIVCIIIVDPKVPQRGSPLCPFTQIIGIQKLLTNNSKFASHLHFLKPLCVGPL